MPGQAPKPSLPLLAETAEPGPAGGPLHHFGPIAHYFAQVITGQGWQGAKGLGRRVEQQGDACGEGQKANDHQKGPAH